MQEGNADVILEPRLALIIADLSRRRPSTWQLLQTSTLLKFHALAATCRQDSANMPSASMLHTRPLSHSRQASLAASVRSKSGSMNGDEAEEPFLSGQEVEENRKSLSGEERRGKSLENSLDHVGFGRFTLTR